MLFSSIRFLIFFLLVCILYFAISKEKYKRIILLISSYIFCICWNSFYTFSLFFSTLSTFYGGKLIAKYPNRKRLYLTITIILNIGILVFFKYANFVILNVNLVLRLLDVNSIKLLNLFIPIGISFYTFQSLSYIFDIYRNDTVEEKSFINYALFVSFFPQLISGPIEKSKDFLKQFDKEHKFEYDRVKNGLLIMLMGFIYKLVIADRLALIVNQVYNNLNNYRGIILLIISVVYSFQIYADFYGYSLIAKGIAKVFGYELYDNFKAPYLAKSIKEFWHRWHISLSTWFRDYLYFPLGGSRVSKIKIYRNIMIVFLISGLWHGANWTFIIWGILHGLYQIIGKITEKHRNNLSKKLKLPQYPKLNVFIKIIVTFSLVTFAWIFFRATSINDALYIISNMFVNFKIDIMSLDMDKWNLIVSLISILVIVFADIIKENIDMLDWLKKRNIVIRWIIYLMLIWILLIFGIYGPGFSESTFIYIQF